MPEKEVDRREEVLGKFEKYIAYVNEDDNIESISIDSAKLAMDEYASEMSISFINYAFSKISGWHVLSNEHVEVKYKGEWITVKQLFENFL